VKILLVLFGTAGEEDIGRQLVKLLEDTLTVPEQDVPLVIAVIEVISIASEK
tara:strand:- start:17 stop:172 length:156 start_codon:yes stop_codon:yes gene_type:complete